MIEGVWITCVLYYLEHNYLLFDDLLLTQQRFHISRYHQQCVVCLFHIHAYIC